MTRLIFMYEIILTDTFKEWLDELDEFEHDKIMTSIGLLQRFGYQLSRPHADTITDSKIVNLKELRTQINGKPYRSFFVFDPLRQAVLLCGGNKTGDKRFYKRMIPIAESIYSEYLNEFQQDNTDK